MTTNGKGTIHFKCPQCGTRVRVSKQMAGKKGKCPKCQTVTMIPIPADHVPPPVSDDNPPEALEVFELQVSSSLDQLASAVDPHGDAHSYTIPTSVSTKHVVAPPYDGLALACRLLQALAVLCWLTAGGVVAVVLVRSIAQWQAPSMFAAVMVIMGVICFALGAAFSCLRDIARNTWRS